MLRYAMLCVIAGIAAAQSPFVNAKLETRSAASGLDAAVRAASSEAASPAWIGYSVPAFDRDSHSCCGGDGGSCRCLLEEQHHSEARRSNPVKLEGPARIAVLIRVENRQMKQVRAYSESCELDAGGLKVYWLTEARPEQSVELLAGIVRSGDGALRDGTMLAIAMHEAESAGRMLDNFAHAPHPFAIREKAIFWLGATRGKPGYEVLQRIVREDPNDAVRDKAIFALSINKTPEAIDALIAAARNDTSAHVRGQALFWLAEKAGRKAQAAITDAIANDPDTQVKKQAVFALTRLPKDESVTLLIQIARTNHNPEVRKQAMFWLGQSGDARAISFFQEILTSDKM